MDDINWSILSPAQLFWAAKQINSERSINSNSNSERVDNDDDDDDQFWEKDANMNRIESNWIEYKLEISIWHKIYLSWREEGNCCFNCTCVVCLIIIMICPINALLCMPLVFGIARRELELFEWDDDNRVLFRVLSNFNFKTLSLSPLSPAQQTDPHPIIRFDLFGLIRQITVL